MKDVWLPMYDPNYTRKRWTYTNARAFAKQHAAENLDGSMRLAAWAQKRTTGEHTSSLRSYRFR